MSKPLTILFLKQKGAVNKVIFVYNGEQAVAVINNVKANVGLTGKALELWVIHFGNRQRCYKVHRELNFVGQVIKLFDTRRAFLKILFPNKLFNINVSYILKIYTL